ncbi:MAG: hypothetical protein WDN23_22525 [Edaphobacter sp.]
MSADTIHVIVTVGIIALMFAWVPFLNVICPPGWRSLRESSREKKARQTDSASSLSSQRLADRSRDLLEALSTRGQRNGVSSHAGPPSSCAE